MFQQIDHIAFNVKDRNKSIDFYEKYFGFNKYYENDVPVQSIEKIVYLKLGDTDLVIINMPNSEKIQGFHFCLESDNFDEDYECLKQAGIPIQMEPHPAGTREFGEKGCRRVVFIGPDGEEIEFRA